MSKKLYFTPVMRVVRTDAFAPYMGAVASEEGIKDVKTTSLTEL